MTVPPKMVKNPPQHFGRNCHQSYSQNVEGDSSPFDEHCEGEHCEGTVIVIPSCKCY